MVDTPTQTIIAVVFVRITLTIILYNLPFILYCQLLCSGQLSSLWPQDKSTLFVTTFAQKNHTAAVLEWSVPAVIFLIFSSTNQNAATSDHGYEFHNLLVNHKKIGILLVYIKIGPIGSQNNVLSALPTKPT